MRGKEVEEYVVERLNMGVGWMMEGERSYRNSLSCKVREEGF